DFDLVYEFGGGFGGLEVLSRALGFEGTYVIVDLPVVRALQRYYLTLAGAPLVDGSEATALAPRAARTELAGIEAFACARDRAADVERSLFVATWSLSETPHSVRAGILETLSSFSHVLVSFQQSLDAIDNSELFETLVAHGHPDMEWIKLPIDSGKREA